jgi:two-component system sensor histidine kinase YesM
MKTSSLRSRLIVGFVVVTAPLLILLMYNNWYAMKVVHNQVAGSNRNLVKMYMNQIDRVLSETDKYLLKTSLQNPDLISLSSYSEGSMEAYFAKINTFIALDKDISYYQDTDAFFAYGTGPKELLLAPQQQVDYDKKEKIKAKLEKLMGDSDARKELVKQWTVLDMDGEYSLLRVVDTQYGSYIGAWIDLNRLLKPLRFLEFGDKSQVLFASSSGRILTQSIGTPLSEMISPLDLKETFADTGEPYSILTYGDNRSASMVVSRPSQVADIYLVVLLPVDTLLENLPVFQRLIYATPVMAVVVLFVYLLYLQRSIAAPVHMLIRGMRKIRSGNLAARLEPSRLSEFNAINETFNNMAEEIEHLKIDIYEQQLNTQKAELRHLQAQIHPHFFMNCLNLIYNLAQVKNMGLVQKLALHLVRHFRFMIRTNLTTVTLKEELDHIRNYLSIQKVRFPEDFDFRIDMEPEVESFAIPPLTVQPFVENAMEHGFCYRDDQPFTISVQAKRDSDCPDKYIVLSIEDNGKGFRSDILSKLQSGDYFQAGVDHHIGIWNVQHRCRLYYRSDAQLTFANKPQGGAAVILKLPVQESVQQGRGSDVSGVSC